MILGAVLAGGGATRFGSDKALAMLDGARLIDRAIAGLAPLVDRVAVCGRDWPGTLSLPDRPAGGEGPLAGLAAALHHAAANGYAGVLSVPCDLAAVPADLAVRLGVPGAAAYLAAAPVVGWWPAALAAPLDALLAAPGPRAVRRFADRAGALAVAGTAPANINTPADLIAAERSGGGAVSPA